MADAPDITRSLSETPENGPVDASPAPAPGPAAPKAAEPKAEAPAPAAAAPAPAAQAPAAPAETGHVVKSPMVGTFYRSSAPGAPAFVEVGANVKEGDTLCIIEAMKLMNEIDSEFDGEIVSIYVENGQPVQYGERLFALRSK